MLNVKWMISFVYGPPHQKSASDFWDKLANCSLDTGLPWLCIGDFNAIISPIDKFGGRPFYSNFNNSFSHFLNTMGMIDLGFSGNPYTWSNNRQGLGLIKERLDRGIASLEWIHTFPNFFVTHLPAHTSDHNPLILDTDLPLPSLPRLFKFEEFWYRDPSCNIVINEAWSTLCLDPFLIAFQKKLKHTKKALKLWNKHFFGDIRTKLSSTLHLLDVSQ
jgi:hypothetical protein